MSIGINSSQPRLGTTAAQPTSAALFEGKEEMPVDAAVAAGKPHGEEQAANARLRAEIFAQLALNNLSEFVLKEAPDTSRMRAIQLVNSDGETRATAWLDAKSRRVYYQAEAATTVDFKPYWAGPLLLRVTPRQAAHLRDCIEQRLLTVNLADTVLSGPPSGYQRLVPVAFGAEGSSARKVAFVDFEGRQLYVHVKPASGKPYWSGPIDLAVPALPRLP